MGATSLLDRSTSVFDREQLNGPEHKAESQGRDWSEFRLWSEGGAARTRPLSRMNLQGETLELTFSRQHEDGKNKRSGAEHLNEEALT